MNAFPIPLTANCSGYNTLHPMNRAVGRDKVVRPLHCFSNGGGGNTGWNENYWGREGSSRFSVGSNVMNIKTVYGCRRFIDEIAE